MALCWLWDQSITSEGEDRYEGSSTQEENLPRIRTSSSIAVSEIDSDSDYNIKFLLSTSDENSWTI